MADYMPASLTLPTWAIAHPAVATAIQTEGPDSAVPLPDGTSRLDWESAPYGQLATLESCLKRYGIAFDAHGDGRYDYNAENRYFRPAEPGIPALDSAVYTSAFNDEPMIPLSQLARVQRENGRLTLKGVRAFLGLPTESLAAWAGRHGPSDAETRLMIDNVAVVLEDIGEGRDGDYNADDPTDEAFYRFTVFVQVDPESGKPLRADQARSEVDATWDAVDGASYCTQLPCSVSHALRIRATAYLLEEFYDVLATFPTTSVKKLGERLSWIKPADFPETPLDGAA
jgi:hypothetical protein